MLQAPSQKGAPVFLGRKERGGGGEAGKAPSGLSPGAWHKRKGAPFGAPERERCSTAVHLTACLPVGQKEEALYTHRITPFHTHIAKGHTVGAGLPHGSTGSTGNTFRDTPYVRTGHLPGHRIRSRFIARGVVQINIIGRREGQFPVGSAGCQAQGAAAAAANKDFIICNVVHRHSAARNERREPGLIYCLPPCGCGAGAAGAVFLRMGLPSSVNTDWP